MVEKNIIKQWINEEYNDYMAVQIKDNFVRMTNGSMAYAVDIYSEGSSFILEGERYGETITDSCDANKKALMKTLSKNI